MPVSVSRVQQPKDETRIATRFLGVVPREFLIAVAQKARAKHPATISSVAESFSSHRIVHDDVWSSQRRLYKINGETGVPNPRRDYLASRRADGTIGAGSNEGWAMDQEKNLRVIGSGAAEITRFPRRMVVQVLLARAGAGAAWPLVANSHPIYGLLSGRAVLDEVEKLGAADWKPAFLSSQQNETLTAIAESAVPGSTKALVSRFIDLLLSMDKPENQHKFLESLTALDTEALKRFGKRFPALDEEQKNALLSDVSIKAESPKTLEADAGKKQPSLYGHFENLKGLVSGAYYSSEVGMRELGWTGDYVFERFRGCPHPEGYH